MRGWCGGKGCGFGQGNPVGQLEGFREGGGRGGIKPAGAGRELVDEAGVFGVVGFVAVEPVMELGGGGCGGGPEEEEG